MVKTKRAPISHEYDLSPAERKMLELLRRAGPRGVPQHELARALGWSHRKTQADALYLRRAGYPIRSVLIRGANRARRWVLADDVELAR